MKSILILSLLFVCVFSAEEAEPVELESASDIIAIVKCFLGKEELITDVTDIIEIIKSGDYSKLLTVAFKVYADVTAAIKECVPQEIDLESKLPLNWGKRLRYHRCLKRCSVAEDAEACKKACKEKYYPTIKPQPKPFIPCKKTCTLEEVAKKKCRICRPIKPIIKPVKPVKPVKPAVIPKTEEESN